MENDQINENDLKELFWSMQKQIIIQGKAIEQLKKEIFELAKKDNENRD